MKSLIIDDDIMTTDTLKYLMLNYGPCDGVFDGMDGLEYFRNALIENKPYDLVMLDFDMPMMDGYEAIEKLKKIEKETKVKTPVKIIMISGVEGVEEIQKHPSWDGFIEKPFHKIDIANAVIRVMDIPE